MPDAESALHLPAGYDPSMSPETFIQLGKAEAAMRKSMGGNLGALQCTHPRSDSRVQMLQEELALMQVGYCCCVLFFGLCMCLAGIASRGLQPAGPESMLV